jgi:spore coat polysaccharide biosynthesis protein SpsF (cytidylyltransferase family)
VERPKREILRRHHARGWERVPQELARQTGDVLLAEVGEMVCASLAASGCVLLRGQDMNVLCVIQARYGSKRLPGKMLMKLGGETLIERGYRLACGAFGKESVVIATPLTEENSPLHAEVKRLVARYTFYGEDDDVLLRFYRTAQLHGNPSTIHRWTCDDWRKDPEMCRRVVSGETGIPVEIGGEAFTFAQLKEWHETVTDPFLREHIGHLITPNPVSPPDDGLPWSIDTQEQLEAANNSLLCTETV